MSFATQEQSQSLTKHLLDQLGIDTNHIGDLQNVSVDKLQEASTQALQETANEYHIPAPLGGGYQMEWGPVVDGDVLPSNPVTDDAFAEAGKNVTLLIGSNLNEWTGSQLRPPCRTELTAKRWLPLCKRHIRIRGD